MRKIFALMFSIFFISTQAFSQTDTACGVLPLKNGQVFYTGLEEISGATTHDLYVNTKLWIAAVFGSAKKVIQADVEDAAVSISGLIPDITDDKGFGFYSINMSIQFKNERLRYEISQIHFIAPELNIETAVESMPAFKECKLKALIDVDISIKHFVQEMITKLKSVDYDW